MAKSDKNNGGVTQGDIDAYKELNSELPGLSLRIK
jgi:hypothetical protein